MKIRHVLVVSTLVAMCQATAAKAGDVVPTPMHCGQNARVTCEKLGDKKYSCSVLGTFTREAPNHHLYVCELHLTPKIRDDIGLTVKLTKSYGFVPYSFSFASNADDSTLDNSVLSVEIIRPRDNKDEVSPEGTIEFSGTP